MTEKLKFLKGRVENIVGKGENAGYQHFLFFPTMFSKGFILMVLKSQGSCDKEAILKTLLPAKKVFFISSKFQHQQSDSLNGFRTFLVFDFELICSCAVLWSSSTEGSSWDRFHDHVPDNISGVSKFKYT